MTGEKKIVGLWRNSATNQEADSAAPTDAAAPESPHAPDIEAPADRDWLDMSSLSGAEEIDDAPQAPPTWRERVVPAPRLGRLSCAWAYFEREPRLVGRSGSLRE